MSLPVNPALRALATLALGGLIALVPGLAASDGDYEEQAGEHRWVPSLAIVSGVTIDGEKGDVRSFYLTRDAEVRPPADGRDLAVSPFVGFDFELLTPAIAIPGRPRLFLSAEMLPTFARSRDIAKEGNPTEFDPPTPNPQPQAVLPIVGRQETAILGQGSRTTSQLDTLFQYGAGLGVAIPFEWRDRPLRFKLSAEWSFFKLNYEGLVMRAECVRVVQGVVTTTECLRYDPPDFPPVIRPPVDGFTREIVMQQNGWRTYHALGPGLELEMDAGRMGWLGYSIFLGARFQRIFGDTDDRTLHLSVQNSYPAHINPDTGTATIPADETQANWSWKVDPWMYRIVMGLRFNYVGPIGR